jgi:hypothetical protein
VTGPPTSPPRGGSLIRLGIGALLFVVATATAAYGGIRLGVVLEQGGYGTPAVQNALLILGAGGGMLATSIALIIWDVSLRHER